MAFDFAYVIKQSFVNLFSDSIIFALAVVYAVASSLFALLIYSPMSSFINSKANTIPNVEFLFVYLAVYLLFTAFLQDIAFVRIFNKKKDIAYIIKMSVQRFPSFFATSILEGVLVTLGFIAFVIPGIYFLFKLILAPASSVIEKKNPFDALRRSWELTNGNWWALFLAFLILGIIVGVLSFLPYISYFFGFLVVVAYPLALMQLLPKKKSSKKRSKKTSH